MYKKMRRSMSKENRDFTHYADFLALSGISYKGAHQYLTFLIYSSLKAAKKWEIIVEACLIIPATERGCTDIRSRHQLET